MSVADGSEQELQGEVGRIIRSIRKRLRLSVRRVSDRGQVNGRHWQKIEAGEVNVTLETLKRIASALEVDPYVLLPGPSSAVHCSAVRSKTGKELAQSVTARETEPDPRIVEIIDGTLHKNAACAPKLAYVHAVLIAILVRSFGMDEGGPGGWQILSRPEVRFPVSLHGNEDILVPEIAGWRLERMPALPDAPYLTLAPDWACEVISASTARIDRMEKLRIYAREGLEHVWLVDPSLHTLEVFSLDEARRWKLVASFVDSACARAVPFDAIEVNLSKLWALDKVNRMQQELR